MAVEILDWPAGVPDCIMPLSPQGGLRDNRYSFETDSRQAPIERPRSSWSPEVYSVTLAPMTRDQFAAFQTWYKSDLRYGVNAFGFKHPITRQLMPWRIVKGDPPYQVSKARMMPYGSDKRGISVSFQIMSYPGDIEASFLVQEQSSGDGEDLILQEQSDAIIVEDGYTFDG